MVYDEVVLKNKTKKGKMMNQKIFLLIVIVINFCNSIILTSNISPKSVPSELCKKIACCFEIIPQTMMPLCKFDRCDSSSGNEKLHFPTTGFIEFIKSTSSRDPITLGGLRKLDTLSLVLPHVQLWSKNSTFRIDDDLKSFSMPFNFRDCDAGECTFLFDLMYHFNLIVEKRPSVYRVTVSDLSKGGKILLAYNQVVNYGDNPISLCFHRGIPSSLFSIVIQRNPEKYDSVCCEYQKIQFFKAENDMLLSTDTEIIPKEMPLIQKHEHIGANTFLLLAAGQLFFGAYDKDGRMSCKKQILYSQKEKKRQELEICSFSVDQEHSEDRRTPNGRARFFAVVVQEPLDDNSGLVQKKLLLADLLNPLNMLFKVWQQANPGQKGEDFDRVSFGDDTVSLWNDQWDKSDAMKIELKKDCPDLFEYLLLMVTMNETNCLSDLI
jgi:hypothetical protein